MYIRTHTHTHTHVHSHTHTGTHTQTHTTVSNPLRFMTSGCGCRRSCTSHFNRDHVLEVRAQCLELTRENLDIALLGQLMASLNISDSVVTESRHAGIGRGPTIATRGDWCAMQCSIHTKAAQLIFFVYSPPLPPAMYVRDLLTCFKVFMPAGTHSNTPLLGK